MPLNASPRVFKREPLHVGVVTDDRDDVALELRGFQRVL